MLWLVWRQHRMQALVTAALLLAFGVVLWIHGMGTADLAEGLAPGSDELDNVVAERFQGMYLFVSWLPVVPVLIGLFWGAPVLAKEFETGTAKLAWTQSVSPRRWLTSKLGGLGVLVTLGGLALGGMINGWLATFDGASVVNRLADLPLFGGSGVASAAWWLFAFVLGVAAGTVTRRTLSAMAVTLAAYVVVFMVVASPLLDFRDMYAEPEQLVQTSASDSLPDGSLIAGSQWLDPAGRELDASAVDTVVDQKCGSLPSGTDFSPCLFKNGYQEAVYYQPPSRYWRFQWTEAAILLAAAVALSGYVVYRTARRLV